ncbi:hypothetical protein M3C58_08550 [Brachybacterium muris]|uniref:hypothetical protein n=1 Tax=Brachybacterium muris TaxID=219301 RepID=UPI0021A611DA|nr:hypothetical protein [Brachybacterium muris]MCT1998241.1 hypothetical protein [Brachybacterium muris]
MTKFRAAACAVASLLVGFAAGVVLAWLLDLPQSPGAVSSFLHDFALSPGVGGAAAVVAATIAFIAASQSRRESKRAATVAQWWENARWATNMLLGSPRAPEPDGWWKNLRSRRPPQPAQPYGWDELTDSDAQAALTALSHLAETAPDEEHAAFVMAVLEAVLGEDNEFSVDPDSPVRQDGHP